MVARRSVKKTKETVEEAPVIEESPVLQEDTPVVQSESSEETKIESEGENELQISSTETKSELRMELENLTTCLEEILQAHASQVKHIKALAGDLKKFSLKISKDLKKKEKKMNNKKPVSQHGFNAPVPISDDLAKFMSLPKGSILRRPEVTKFINKYTQDHGLKNESNKAIFLPDAKLKKLLGPAIYPLKKKEPELKGYGIFNIQIYLKKHFLKVEQTPVN